MQLSPSGSAMYLCTAKCGERLSNGSFEVPRVPSFPIPLLQYVSFERVWGIDDVVSPLYGDGSTTVPPQPSYGLLSYLFKQASLT